MAKGHATVLTKARDQYISKVEFKSHAEAATWAGQLQTAKSLTAADTKNVTWPDTNPKKTAIQWPA